MNKNPEIFILWAIRIPKSYLNKLRLMKKRTHISLSEQIRTALRDYFQKNDL